MAPSDRTERGLSLVEVAAAVAILGGVIVGLLMVRTRAQVSYAAANEMMICTRLCASEAARLRAGPATEGEGIFSQPAGYRWRIRRSSSAETLPAGLNAYEIQVTPPSGDEENSVTVVLWLLSPEAPQEDGK